MPTEFLHGLYDGGAGAGLADYWDVIRTGNVRGGGFIWAFLDEGVRRVDETGDPLDTNGNSAPDGIVGPYRQPEGSYYTIKEVWSPIVFTDTAAPTVSPVTLHVCQPVRLDGLAAVQFCLGTAPVHAPQGQRERLHRAGAGHGDDRLPSPLELRGR